MSTWFTSSLVDNYRAQFKDLFATASYSALIASKRAKTTDDTMKVGTRESAACAVGREVPSQGA